MIVADRRQRASCRSSSTAARLYTGAITAHRPAADRLAGRIAVNAALLADPSEARGLCTSPPTPAGDTTRPDFILDRS